MKKILSFILAFFTIFVIFGTQVSSNTSYSILPTTITNVVNKPKLDLFLNKILESKSNFNTEANYLIFLNRIYDKLTSLANKYSSNSDIQNMVEYLNIGIKNIINITKQNSDVDDFLCEVLGDCLGDTKGNTSSSSSGLSTSTPSSGGTNNCGTGKKLIGSVCVADTSQINPNGNYKIGQGACVSHTGNDVGYNGSSYTLPINGQTHGIGKTLNQCIEACDIGNLNIGGNGGNCFYEGALIRSGINGSIINVTAGKIISIGTGTTGTTPGVTPVGSSYISTSIEGDKKVLNFFINKALGYQKCFISLGSAVDFYTINSNGTTSGNGNITGLGNYYSEGTFEGKLYYPNSGGEDYVNFYCGKTTNATYSEMDKIMISTKLKDITNMSIVSSNFSKIPNVSSSSSCSGIAPTGAGIIKSTSVYGMVGSDTWNYVNNTKGTSTDLGQSCQWTCAPGYVKSGNACGLSGISSGKVYLSNVGPNDLSKLNGSIYVDKPLYVILDGVSKSNPPKGCAKLAGTLGCDTVPGFRDYTSSEWANDTRIVSVGSANAFPIGNYEFYSLYGTTIAKVGYGSLIASPVSTLTCAGSTPTGAGIIKSTSVYGMVGSDTWNYVTNTKGTSTDLGQSCQWTCSPGYNRSGNTCTAINSSFTGNETVSVGNSFPTYGNNACMEDTIYVVPGGLNKSSQPKGCAQPIGSGVCTSASAFRSFTNSEWVSDTTVVTTFGANQAPVGVYEFFIMYGSEIKKIGSGEVRKCR